MSSQLSYLASMPIYWWAFKVFRVGRMLVCPGRDDRPTRNGAFLARLEFALYVE